ncbi:aldehyde dehydrogenase family protein [Streptomyces sp. NPDC006365]|uniref:aldehyde dehydrogenase family protein n=1 Tax=Streptomyces sp. NPDC006365 TaxID=3364744 RepID=UPI0036CD8EE8
MADAFTAPFVAAVGASRVGDPRERGTRVGPFAHDDLRAAIQQQIEESAAGADQLAGGRPLPGDSCFYQPTVLADAGPGVHASAPRLQGVVSSPDRHLGLLSPGGAARGSWRSSSAPSARADRGPRCRW